MIFIDIFLIFILFFAGVLLKGLIKRNLMDLNMSTHCLCQLKTKSNQRIHVQRNLKIVHFIKGPSSNGLYFIAFIQYDRYINAAILIHTIFTNKIMLFYTFLYVIDIYFSNQSSQFDSNLWRIPCQSAFIENEISWNFKQMSK